MIRSLRKAAELFEPRELAVGTESCALCGFRIQLRLRRDEVAVRCVRCGASAITQSLVDVLRQSVPRLASCDVYELSAAGALVAWMRGRARSLTTSELLDGVAPGATRDGVTCQDVQRLTYADASFDLCTSTEVFEHVEDDLAGFREILRVLRPGGMHVFTVPLDTGGTTIERTRLRDGQRVATLPPEYHADRYRGSSVFCYRNYGADILDRLQRAGFVGAEFRRPQRRLFGYARPVVVARRP